MRRRVLGWLLILYGIAGLVLVGAGAAVGVDVAARIERLAADADGTLTAAASATQAAADSFTSVDTSLADAQTSASAAAALSREASGTLSSLAVAMQLSLFGAQPLLPLADEFSTSAGQAAELAETLDSVGASLGDTRTDVSRVGAELAILGEQLTALRSSGDGADGAPPPLRLFIGLLVAWLAVPAVGAIVGGLVLLRGPYTTTTIVERVEAEPRR